MLKYLVVGLLFISNISIAGMPGEDQVIDSLRTVFKSQAYLPTLDTIQLNKNWTCKELMAVKSDFNNYSHEKFFQFVNSGVNGYVPNLGTSKVTLFKFTDQGLAGAYQEFNNDFSKLHVVYLKMKNNNTIIGELAVNSLIDGKPIMAPSLVTFGMFAKSYFVCTVQDN